MFRHQIRTVLCLPVLAAGAGREVDAAKDGDDELLPLPVVPGLHLQPAALQIMFWLRVLDIFRGLGVTCSASKSSIRSKSEGS